MDENRSWQSTVVIKGLKLPSGSCPYKIGMVKIAGPHEKNAIQKLEMRILVRTLSLPVTHDLTRVVCVQRLHDDIGASAIRA
jgi:hypothetical protein